jgi:signal transduction histidine kinase/DNA-binding response OmpR family regulator
MDDSRQPLILTIENDALMQDRFHQLLKGLDYRVMEAADGRTGLAVFDRQRPDLVLLDLCLPGMGGLEVLARILESAPDTPVIIFSGDGRVQDVVEALRCGACDFLVKPVEDLSIFKHCVERCLERARLIQENHRYRHHLEEIVHERTRDLAAANRKLAVSEEKYRLLFESMRHGVALCRYDGQDVHAPLGAYRLTEVNAAFEAMVAMDAAALQNQSLDALFPGLDGQGAVPGDSVQDGHPLEYYDRSQERTFDMLMYHRGNGDLVLMMADVTERRRLKEQLQQSQKMEAIGTLAGGIAHDFNNILGAMMGYGELALLELDSDHPSRRKVEQVLGSCHRAKDLVARILSFSRRNRTERRRVRVGRVVEEVLELLRAALPTTIEIRKRIRFSEALVSADTTQIHQIIMNLCTNARHAMEEAGGVLTVCVDRYHSAEGTSMNTGVLPAGDYVCLSVEDTGSGMDAKTLRRAFDPYFTTKAKGDGTGLGLSVVQGIVKNWKGEVRIASTMGQGTAVHVYVPRIREAEEAAKEAEKRLTKGSGRVLMVDDEKSLVDVGRQMLERAGYVVASYTCPAEALAAFKENSRDFDLVITDMTMPKLTGSKLAQQIRRIAPHIPIMLFTGNREAAEKARADGSDFTKVLLKPLTMSDLLKSVGGVLEQARKRH